MTREKRLIRQMEEGDRQALGTLIRLYYDDIFRYCRWHTTRPEDAEDAVQETFLKMVRYMDGNRFGGELRPFLYKIAKNVCIDLNRKRYRADVPLDELETEPAYLEEAFQRSEEEAWLHQLIRDLEQDAQEILLLRFGQELTLRETAEIMGLPLRTVQSKVRASLKRLRKADIKR